MDHIPVTSYLQMPPDTLQVVRKDINMDKPGEMKEAVRILDEWVKEQPHFLEKNISPHYLEMTIVTSKGSVERAKRILENMFTARTLRPHDFMPCDLREYHALIKGHGSVILMPTLTSEYYRLFIAKLSGKLKHDVLDAAHRFVYSILDYTKTNDYHSGIVIIFDLTEADMQYFVTHINLLEAKNCTSTILGAYGMRLKKCHLITTSKAIQVLIAFFGAWVGKKIMDRVVVNGNIDEIAQYYSKDALPKDYGGNEKTILELQDELLEKVSTDEHIQHMKLMSGCTIEKSMSPNNLLNIEDGVYGTFRSLNLD